MSEETVKNSTDGALDQLRHAALCVDAAHAALTGVAQEMEHGEPEAQIFCILKTLEQVPRTIELAALRLSKSHEVPAQ